MTAADPASPQPDAARWIASNTPCLGCLHQYVSHRRDFGECALCGCVSFKNPEDQPEPAPPSAESYRLAELEALERAVVEWRHCRVTGTDGVQLVCDHDRKLAAASRAAYRRVYPTE